MSEPDEADMEAIVAAIRPQSQGDGTSITVAAVLATPVVADWRRDAERLRDLAAMFEGHPNRDQQTYRGVQIAAMLRGDGT